ncbi:hypothetical protein IFT84_17420 [Rhizobium sp. CFBP 8762]|uniref:tape measure protein n=1 Tax=Rhizobium sp. CFBP 8762 TaxID=2775279 RepID=UPI001783120A|nr:tape measure protein [Rhizobium sp. CFBP 8762]MBD8556291.1 hypothetical protein [Rhizobium sp. CFBP 8762]
MIIDELVAILGYDIQGEANLKKFTAGIETAAAKLVSFAAVATAAAAGAMTLLGKNVISTSATFESYAATLETIEGSAEKAKASLDWVANFGKTTPYEVGEVTEAFVRLKAYGLDPMDGTLSAVGDAASAMGKGLMQGVEAIADAATGEFERLKEFGIKSKAAGDDVTFSWSKNGKELTKTVKKNSTEITKFLKENFGDRFNGAMEKQSKTFNGIVSNLQDTWVDFQRRIGDAGFFDAVKNQLGRLTSFIDRLDEDGTIDRWAKNLSDGFVWATDVIGSAFTVMQRNFATLSQIIDENKGVFEAFKWALVALAAYVFPITAVIVALGLALEDFLTYMRGGESVIGAFIEWMKQLPSTLSDTFGELFPKAIAAFQNIIGAIQNQNWLALGQNIARFFLDGVREIGTNLVRLITDSVSSVDWSGIGLQIANGLMTGIKGLVGFLAGFWSEVASDAIKTFSTLGSAMGQAIFDGLKAWGASIQAWFANLIPNINLGGAGTGGDGSTPGRFDLSLNPDDQRKRNLAGAQDAAARAIENYRNNTVRQSGGSAATAVANDNSQDNRNQSVVINSTVNQTVTQATAAPGAAAQATGAAVSGAVGAARVEQGPAF